MTLFLSFFLSTNRKTQPDFSKAIERFRFEIPSSPSFSANESTRDERTKKRTKRATTKTNNRNVMSQSQLWSPERATELRQDKASHEKALGRDPSFVVEEFQISDRCVRERSSFTDSFLSFFLSFFRSFSVSVTALRGRGLENSASFHVTFVSRLT